MHLFFNPITFPYNFRLCTYLVMNFIELFVEFTRKLQVSENRVIFTDCFPLVFIQGTFILIRLLFVAI